MIIILLLLLLLIIIKAVHPRAEGAVGALAVGGAAAPGGGGDAGAWCGSLVFFANSY